LQAAVQDLRRNASSETKPPKPINDSDVGSGIPMAMFGIPGPLSPKYVGKGGVLLVIMDSVKAPEQPWIEEFR
jgi:hypothetical protein